MQYMRAVYRFALSDTGIAAFIPRAQKMNVGAMLHPFGLVPLKGA